MLQQKFQWAHIRWFPELNDIIVSLSHDFIRGVHLERPFKDLYIRSMKPKLNTSFWTFRYQQNQGSWYSAKRLLAKIKYDMNHISVPS